MIANHLDTTGLLKNPYNSKAKPYRLPSHTAPIANAPPSPITRIELASGTAVSVTALAYSARASFAVPGFRVVIVDQPLFAANGHVRKVRRSGERACQA